MERQSQASANASPLLDHSPLREAKPSTWPDAWLINAVHRDPPDQEALSVLVDRYWKPLYVRCRLLTHDDDKARDLAQESWLHLLRARHSLKANGHFQAYVVTIATNLWRDMNRAAMRAGPMAESRMASLESSVANDAESMALIDEVADPRTLSSDDQLVLEMDLDDALARLDPRLRDVLISRFIDGESAAEIGHRYDRTEQAISGWIRDAVRQMKTFLGEARGGACHREER
jgi:RNA polymerase sigma-70 factor (ECF subfamily)